MRKGLELLYVNRNNLKTKIEELEKENSIALPFLYKRFVLQYDTSRIKREMFYSNEFNGLYPCSSQKFTENQEVEFYGFVPTIEKAFELWNEQDEVLKAKKYFPVGTSGVHPGGLFVGLIGEDAEKIFLDTDFKERFLFVSENIFDFVGKLEEFEIEQKYIRGQISKDRLYKNWGEDFWRIREDSPI